MSYSIEDANKEDVRLSMGVLISIGKATTYKTYTQQGFTVCGFTVYDASTQGNPMPVVGESADGRIYRSEFTSNNTIASDGKLYCEDGTLASFGIGTLSDGSVNISIVYCTDDGTSYRVDTTAGATVTFTGMEDKSGQKIHIVQASRRDYFSWNNNNIISCDVNLRTVQTTIDNPELQCSEIEFQVYDPYVTQSFLETIENGTKIKYEAGYCYFDGNTLREDTTIRCFYLDGMPTKDGNLITFHGYDATYFLDTDYAGQSYAMYPNRGVANIVNVAINAIGSVLGDYDSGGQEFWDAYLTWDEPTGSGSTDYGLFVDKDNIRSIIANMVNRFRYGVADNESTQFRINYLHNESGRIILEVTNEAPTVQYRIPMDQIGEVSLEVERKITTLTWTQTYPEFGDSETVVSKSRTKGKRYIATPSEPHRTWTATNATINSYSPYKCIYTATATGTVTIKGRPISLDEQETLSYNGSATYGETVELPQMNSDCGFYITSSDEVLWEDFAAEQLKRSNMIYTFTYRGNPHISPWDLIEVELEEGTYTEMTVETVELNHSDGGLTSQIVARVGRF